MDKNEYLAHWGIRGMKWGVRRFQNPDGSLTSSGRKRYQKKENKGTKIIDLDGDKWKVRKDFKVPKTITKKELKKKAEDLIKKQEEVNRLNDKIDKNAESTKKTLDIYKEVANLPKISEAQKKWDKLVFDLNNTDDKALIKKLSNEAEALSEKIYQMKKVEWEKRGIKHPQHQNASISKKKSVIGAYAKANIRMHTNPILTRRATAEDFFNDLKSKKYGTFLRKNFNIHTPSEIRAINDRVDALKADKKRQRRDKVVARIMQSANEFEPFLESGMTDKKGKVLFTPKEVQEMQSALKSYADKKLGS